MTDDSFAHTATFVCSRLARQIIRTESVDEIVRAALDALSDGLGVSRGSVLFFDEHGVMRFKAWRGLSDEYRQAVEGHSPWTPSDKNASTIVVPDVARDVGLQPFHSILQAEHIASLAFVPLEGSNGVVGKFMLYFEEPRDLTPQEIALAELIASQIAFAVERTEAHLSARASEERLRFALEAANVGTWDWNVKTGDVAWSPNMAAIHGLPAGASIGTFEAYEREIHPDDRERVRASITRALREGVPHEVEYRIVAPDGTVRWVEGKGRLESASENGPVRMRGVCMNITRRKEAEFARAEAQRLANHSSQWLAAVIESSDDAIVSRNLDGIITSWNAGAERLFGYRELEVLGKSISVILPPDRREEEMMELSHIREGLSLHKETIRRRKDGTLVSIALTVSPVRDSDGHIIGASKIARDITERKRSESERAELNRRLGMLIAASASLLDFPEETSVRAATVSLACTLLEADACAVWSNSDGGGWHVDQSTGLSNEFANRVISSYRGSPVERSYAEGVLSKPVPVANVLDTPMLEEQTRAYRAEGIKSMLVCPLRYRRNIGTLVFYYRRSHQFSEGDVEAGQALANIASAAMNIAALLDEQRAQRIRAEEANRQASFLAQTTGLLGQSLDYEQTLVDVSKLAVPTIADWCAVDIVNEHGTLQRLAVAHVDPEKVAVAHQLQDEYPSDPNSAYGVHAVVRTGQPVIMASISSEAIAVNARDEKHRQLLEALHLTSYMCVPLVSTRGILGAMTFVYGDSGRRYGPDDLRFAQDVAARAALAIDNAFAYHRAEEANRLKDEFLATLSHELRTPLNAVLGYAHMVRTGILQGARQKSALDVIARNAHALGEIIEDLLDVSRITAGKLQLDMQPVDVADVVTRALATLQPAIDAKKIAIKVESEPGLPVVNGDPDRLEQVIRNLLSNAVKFVSRRGSVRVEVKPSVFGVAIDVTDDGQGIDPTFLPHMFERFRQGDSRAAREHGGLGLGLAIVKELVELHGGIVSASSPGLGCGATFRIDLPVTQDGTQSTAKQKPQASRASAPQLAGLRVLIVDDDTDALELLRTVLETAGATVVEASSGVRALSRLRRKTVDVVLTDIGMPGMDGYELIRRIRNLPSASSGVPAAAVTGYARSQDRVTVLERGFQAHIAKPFVQSEVVSVVSELASFDKRRVM